MELTNLIKEQAYREGYTRCLMDVMKNMQPYEDITVMKILEILNSLMDTQINEWEANKEHITNITELLQSESHHA